MTARRDHLISIEEKVQSRWAESHIFETNSESDSEAKQNGRRRTDKYMATFPYPYMNGVLHLGHAFTLVKVDFQCQYQRLKGKNVLYPFGFHTTGMPIAACAQKLKQEYALYPPDDPTYRPNFPKGDEDDTIADEPTEYQNSGSKEKSPNEKSPQTANGQTAKALNRKGKGKVAKKASKKIYQYDILLEVGVPASEIHRFTDPRHWLHYFPPIAIEDLKKFGISADFRRSFITTDMNKYYDAFIRWQFRTLKAKGKVKFGERLTIFSPIDNQACTDHDRASGEGAGIVDYTLIKMVLQKPYPKSLYQLISDNPDSSFRNMDFILPAATLRPETMYGQTNSWLLPEGEYGIFKMNDKELFICSDRSALNMSYQKIGEERGKPKKIGTVKGMELMGCLVSAPLGVYPFVPILPLTTIKMDKGTGVVTSVPSDAPDDYAALQDLIKKPLFREKFGIKLELLQSYPLIPVIEIPGLGRQAAADLCEEAKVVSQNDRAKLEIIKEKCYKEGFAKGHMIIGDYVGMKVVEAKPLIKQVMIARGIAHAYSEPDTVVISRSGNECVVALADQWYEEYGEPKWQSEVRNHVTSSNFDTYNPQTLQMFLTTIDWLKEWCCSRSFGLGTRLPWDEQYVIESLSDSTIYMAYYTIAHFLQDGSLTGNPNNQYGIQPEDLTDDVFNYIFLSNYYPNPPQNCKIPVDFLNKLRSEFEYWYPMDLRVSGKDLINNHLTMNLYNHAAIWDNQPEMWPRAFFTNGHVSIDAQKMSKSTGNFITLSEAVKEFSADATRFALADAGDGLDDANFEKKNANAAILKLTKEENWIQEMLNEMDKLRAGDYTFADKVFLNEMNQAIVSADAAYSKMLFRDALKASFHDFQIHRDTYRLHSPVMHKKVLERYFEVSIKLLSPICPHLCQHLWQITGQNKQIEFVCNSKWPIADPVDLSLSRQVAYVVQLNTLLKKSYADMLLKITKAQSKQKVNKKEVKHAVEAAVQLSGGRDASELIDSCILFVAPEYHEWQQLVLKLMSKLYESSKPSPPERKSVVLAVKAEFGNDKKMMEQATKFANTILEDIVIRQADALELALPYNEADLLEQQKELVLRDVPIQHFEIHLASQVSDDENNIPKLGTARKASPGKAQPYFYKQ